MSARATRAGGSSRLRSLPASQGMPLDEARMHLRAALALPYETRDPGRWLRDFQERVSRARRVLAVRAAELRAWRGTHPRLVPMANRREFAHEQLALMADALFTDAYLRTAPDLLDMVDLTEAAKALERAIAREHGRRSDVLFESTHLDIGGDG